MEKNKIKSKLSFKEREKKAEELKKFLLSKGIHEISSRKTGKIYKVKDIKASQVY